MGHIHKFLRQSRTMADRYLGVCREGLGERKAQVILVSVLNITGASAQSLTIPLLIAATHVMEGNTSGRFAFLSKLVSNSFSTIVGICVGLFLLMTYSTFSTYVAAAKNRSLGRDYHLYCARKAIQYFNDTASLDLVGGGFTQQKIQQILMAGALMMGKAVETILLSIRPIAYSVFAAAVLFTIDFWTTLILVPGCLLVIPPLYIAGNRIQTSSREFYNASVMSYGLRMVEILQAINAANFATGSSVSYDDKTDPALANYYRNFDDITLSSQRVLLVTSMFRTFLILAVFILISYQAFYYKTPWGLTIAYTVGLVYALAHFQGLISTLSTLLIYNPRVAEYIEFIDHCQSINKESDVKSLVVPHKLTISSGMVLETTGVEQIELPRGQPVIYINPKTIERVSFSSALRPLTKFSNLPVGFCQNAGFVNQRYQYSLGDVAANLCGEPSPSSVRLKRMKSFIYEAGLQEEIDALPQGVNTLLSKAIHEELSPRLKAALQIFPSVLGNQESIFYDIRIIQGQGQEIMESISSMLSDRFIFLTSEDLNITQSYASQVIVSDGIDILGMGDLEWLDEAKDEIQGKLQVAAKLEATNNANELEITQFM